ncbi:MAG: helix-turn-helix transcriptional regulator [Chloroflexi bacterium]|nr:helix-turn-helix transcriptional regulator [Chloroflexota bacterium]MCI0780695.1 helix-turn-helix transcriptional regulator [Chloroflexota bacterium]MCI0798441.1 helix-turn-helix transcriptional regulator [Chloroflexota bacterium]MCI0894941.1 helix-turn-helix transcriptional regulator [Chloroflexota bacterium]
MPAMMNLKLRLHQRGMTVRELAAELCVPLKTVQDWVYRGVGPSLSNQQKLDEFLPCPHHWVIDAANGHTSRGVCQLCQEVRDFENSTYGTVWIPPKRAAGG